mmetsp:Transcript_12609/g.29789  ORF Transcript_12609/g.29789 Transcript_12609/m.29789 type:complete len:277 (-) Transcript_12609:302-1132(-)
MLRTAVVLVQLFVSGRTAAFNHHAPPASDAMTTITRRMGAAENNSGDECRNLRILCLHGKGGNGEQFAASSLAPLRKIVERRLRGMDATVEWHHLTGPFRLNEEDAAAGHAWWTLRPGERSFNAKEYIGFDQSERVVMNELFLDSDVRATKRYDVVLGHSQGAILTSALLTLHKELRQRDCRFILNGVALPNPHKDSLESLKEARTDSSGPEVLFVMGKADKINPIESARAVHDAFQVANFDTQVVTHEGGHSVPFGKDDDSLRALEEIADWMLKK